MAELTKRLPQKSLKIAGDNSAPGVDVLFEDTDKLFKDNPAFCRSIVAALFCAAVTKTKYGKNAAFNEEVKNFY